MQQHHDQPSEPQRSIGDVTGELQNLTPPAVATSVANFVPSSDFDSNLSGTTTKAHVEQQDPQQGGQEDRPPQRTSEYRQIAMHDWDAQR